MKSDGLPACPKEPGKVNRLIEAKVCVF